MTQFYVQNPLGVPSNLDYNFLERDFLTEKRSRSSAKVICQIPKGSDMFWQSNPQGIPATTPPGEITDRCSTAVDFLFEERKTNCQCTTVKKI